MLQPLATKLLLLDPIKKKPQIIIRDLESPIRIATVTLGSTFLPVVNIILIQ